MKKLMLFVLAALLSFAAAHAQGTATVVVADSTATNTYVPIYGNWADAYLRCQVIYPESMMAELVGSEIQGLTYYLSTPAGAAWTGIFDVKMGTTANATFDAAWADTTSLVTVYTGTLDATGSELTINFSTPFTYTGGNLLIETNQRVKGNYSSCYFYGISSTGSSLQNYSSSAWASITGSQRNFIPKTGFIVPVSCAAPTFTTITPTETSASIAWNEPNSATSWSLKVNNGGWNTISDNPYNLTGLTSNTAYTITLRSICAPGDTSFTTTTSFRTTCGTQTLPYTVGFEPFAAGTDNMAECWTSIEGTNYVRSGSAYASNGSKSLYISDSGVVVTPVIAVGGNDVYVSFDLLRGTAASGKMAVGFAVTPEMAASAIYVDTINPADNSYHNYEYSIPNTIHLPSGCIVFKQIESTSATAYYCIDSLVVTEYSGCLRPVSGTITNVTPSTATINWVAGTDAVSYEVAYDTLDAIAATTPIVPSNTTSINLTGLESETEYNVWVRSVCGENTPWRHIGDFTTQMACAPVSGVTVTAVTYSAIALSWTIVDTIGYSSTMVQVEYKKNSDSVWTETTTTENYAMITGLEAGTNYNIRVRNVCGTDSASAVTITASTQACETEVGTGAATNGYMPTYGYYNYSYTQAIYTDEEVGSIDTITGISFKYNSTTSFNRTLDVYMADIPDATLEDGYINIASFTQVASGYSWSVSNGWCGIVFDEPFVHEAGNDIVIAIDDNTGSYAYGASGTTFAAHAGSGLYKYNDGTNYDPTTPPTGNSATNVPDIRFATVCHLDGGCQAPLVMVDGVTQHEVSLLWTSMGSETSWTVAYRLNGEEDWTVDNSNVTTTSYTISGLNAGSSYQIRVGANCASDTVYAEASAFTECDVVSMPYTEGFETYDAGTSSFPQCWTNVSSTSNYVQSGTSYASAGTKGLHMQGPAIVATTVIALGGNDVYVRCDLKRESANYSGDMAIGIAASASAEDIATAIYFDTITGVPTSSFNTYELTFENTSNIQNGCIVFNQVNTTSTNYYFWLDELVVSEPPTCARPTDLTATATENSLTLTWTENGSATQWVVRANDGAFETVTTNPYTLNGLTANTQYTVTVGAFCNGSDTSEFVTGTFRTTCATETLPYAEGFEIYATSDFPLCWTSVSGNNLVVDAYATEGTKSLRFAGPGTVTTPIINVGGNNLTISFDLRCESLTSSGTMAVGYALTPSDVANAVYLDTITPETAGTFYSHEYTFENTMNIQSGCIVFKQIATSSNYWYWLDNLTVSVVSDCQRPDSGMVANITPASATASWSAAALATEYEVAYGKTADVNNADTIVSVATTTLEITDLTPDSTYYAWVRTVCGAERTLWRALGSFTTQPACAQVTNARVANAGITDMTIAWGIDATVGYASTEVKVSYRKSGVAQWTDTIVNGNQLSLEGLQSGSTYNFRIYNICSSDTAAMVTLSGATQVACAQVVDAQILSTAMTAVAIGWSIDSEVGYASTAVLVRYKEAEAAEWIDTVVTGTNFILTGLTSGTAYNFSIRNICSADTSTAVTVNASTSSCGEVGDGSTTSSYVPVYALYNYSYTQSIYTATEVGNIDTIHGISYNAYNISSEGNVRTIDVYIADVDNASLANGFLPITEFTQVASGYIWNLSEGWCSIPFTQEFVHQAGKDIVIAVDDNTGTWKGKSFKVHAGSSIYANNDDTNFDPANPGTGNAYQYAPDIRFDVTCNITCPAPILVVDAVESHSVTLNWTSLGEETSWIVEYKKATDTVWTVFNDNMTTTSCTIESLEAATGYQFRVGAICGEETAYANVATTTECAPYEVTLTQDYAQNFDNAPVCWSTENDNWYRSSTGGHTGAYVYTSSADMLITPQFDCSTLALGAQVRFWYKLPEGYYGGNSTLKVHYRTAEDGDWTLIESATFATPVENWTEVELMLPNSENASYYQLVFESEAGTGYYSPYLYLDDIVVEAAPTCPRPSEFTLDAVTTTTATISWTSAATLYEVKYHAVGGEWNTVTPAPTSNTVEITGLESSSMYEITVRAICAADDTSRVATYSFNTECGVIAATSLPYFEGFENGINCWEQEDLGAVDYYGETVEWNVGYSYYTSIEGDNYVTIEANEGGSRLISPTFNLAGMENVTLKFAYAQRNYSEDQDSMAVEYRLSPTSEWQVLAMYNQEAYDFQSVTLPLSNVSATFQIAFHAYLNYGYGVAIDSVSITGEFPEIPTCDIPTNITTSNLTANTVTVTWTGSAAQYQVEIVGGGQTYTQTVSTNSYTIETLTQETPYTVRVRALCDNGINSDWSAVVNFTTPQPECGVPTNVQTTTTANSVTITWTGYASEYDVKVTGSEIAPINRTVNTNSCTIDGLVPASTYQVIVRAKCNGQYTDWTAPTTFYTADGQGIDDVQGDFSVSLFPNPAKTSVTLKVDGLNGKANVSLIDMSGRTVMTNTLDGNDELQFNVTTLAKGTYFVRINGETISTVRKLVVQ